MLDAVTAVAAVSVLCYWAYLFGHRRGEHQTWIRHTKMLNEFTARQTIAALVAQGYVEVFPVAKKDMPS